MGWFSRRRRKSREPLGPRARRHPLHVAVQYRLHGQRNWHPAVTRNLSCTGALLEDGALLHQVDENTFKNTVTGELLSRTESPPYQPGEKAM